MTIPGSANPLLLKSAAAAGPVQIERSLRFNSSDSAFLSRAVSTAGNRKTFTFSCWLKRGALSSTTTYQQLFSAGTSLSSRDVFFIDADTDDTLAFYSAGGLVGTALMFRTNAVFRDTSAWYHILLSIDTTQATSTNRVKLYVNSVEQTFATITYPSQNADSLINSAITHNIAAHLSSGEYLSGYLADIHFIDGQALDPSSFTEVSATTGQLIPKAYTGTFTGNSFWLKFSDNSSTTSGSNVGIGKDFSGLGNYWNSTNLSVTAGAGNDSLVDTPTSYGTDTGAGGEVRGNYCTFNPLLPTLTPTNGNLDTPNSTGQNYSTIAVSTGKWYVETTVGPITAGTACGLGLHFNPSAESGAGFYTSGAYIALLYENNLSRYEGTNSNVNFYPTAGAGSILAFRLDLDSGTQTISYYVNNVLITSSNLPAGKTWFVTTRQNNSQSLNFGQRAFAYTAPSGFKALCDTNLTSATITTSGSYTGNGVADGPFVYLNGVPTAMTIGGNAVTFGTHADKLANGFKIRTSSTTYNQNALSYNYSITSTGAAFKNARAQPNP